MRKTDVRTVENAAPESKVKCSLDEVLTFRSCLTCVYRKPYPASMRGGQPTFHRFFCSLAVDSLKPVVTPADVCPRWTGASLEDHPLPLAKGD